MRKTAIVALLALVWEIAARIADNDLPLPTFSQTALAFATDLRSGELIDKAAISISLLRSSSA